MIATVEFSAQFGGRDAATTLLPHFKALKAVSENLSVENFPYKKLAFILRIDGEINSYNLSGPGNLDFDGDSYVSVDLGIQKGEYQDCINGPKKSIIKSLRSSVEFLRKSSDTRLEGIDFDIFEEVVNELIESYEATTVE